MTQFEYITIGVSIVLALAVARILEGLRDSFDPSRRYPIHALWVVSKLLNTLIYFWAGWLYRGAIERWNFATFLVYVLPPALLFLQVHTLLTAHPDAVADWRSHFWRIRRWFFAVNAALALLTSLLVLVVVGSREVAVAALLALNLLVSIAGFASAGERLHRVLAIAYLLILSLGLGNLFLATP